MPEMPNPTCRCPCQQCSGGKCTVRDFEGTDYKQVRYDGNGHPTSGIALTNGGVEIVAFTHIMWEANMAVGG